MPARQNSEGRHKTCPYKNETKTPQNHIFRVFYGIMPGSAAAYGAKYAARTGDTSHAYPRIFMRVYLRACIRGGSRVYIPHFPLADIRNAAHVPRRFSYGV